LGEGCPCGVAPGRSYSSTPSAAGACPNWHGPGKSRDGGRGASRAAPSPVFRLRSTCSPLSPAPRRCCRRCERHHRHHRGRGILPRCSHCQDQGSAGGGAPRDRPPACAVSPRVRRPAALAPGADTSACVWSVANPNPDHGADGGAPLCRLLTASLRVNHSSPSAAPRPTHTRARAHCRRRTSGRRGWPRLTSAWRSRASSWT
jgi:hypothetical protein